MPVELSSRSPISVQSTLERATAPNSEENFRTAVGQGIGALMSGMQAAGGLLPGGNHLVAAVRNTSGALSSSDVGVSADANIDTALDRSHAQQVEFIALQQRISDENRQYTTLSNVLKTRHETAKNAINNIR